jgi:hypothetical protein
MQQSASGINRNHGGLLDPTLLGNLNRILPAQVGGLTTAAGANPTTISSSFTTPPTLMPSSLCLPQGRPNDMAALQASLLPSRYSSTHARGMDSTSILQSLQRVQESPVLAPTASASMFAPGRVSSSALGTTCSTISSTTSQEAANSSSSNSDRARVLHVPSDDDLLSPYQCLVRKQIEVFRAGQADIHASAQGRNRPIILGQVGIRCVHCGPLPIESRSRGAVYFPSTLMSTYQTAQNMANSHLLKDCRHIPRDIREDLIRVRLRENSESKNTRKSAFGGGRSYWARGLRTYHGVHETSDKRLRFDDDHACGNL